MSRSEQRLSWSSDSDCEVVTTKKFDRQYTVDQADDWLSDYSSSNDDEPVSKTAKLGRESLQKEECKDDDIKLKRKRVFSSSDSTSAINEVKQQEIKKPTKKKNVNKNEAKEKIRLKEMERYQQEIEGRKTKIFSMANLSQRLRNEVTQIFEQFDNWCRFENSTSTSNRKKWLARLDEILINIIGVENVKTAYSGDNSLLKGIKRKKVNPLKISDVYANQALFMSHGAARHVMSKSKRLNIASYVNISKEIFDDVAWLGLPEADRVREICDEEDLDYLQKKYEEVKSNLNLNYKAMKSVYSHIKVYAQTLKKGVLMPFSLHKFWLDKNSEITAYSECNSWLKPLKKLLNDHKYDIRILFNLEQTILAQCVPNVTINQRLSQLLTSFELWMLGALKQIGDDENFGPSFIVDAMKREKILCPGYPWKYDPFDAPKRKITIRPWHVRSCWEHMKDQDDGLLALLTKPRDIPLLHRDGRKYNSELDIDVFPLPYEGAEKITKYGKEKLVWKYKDYFIEILIPFSEKPNRKSSEKTGGLGKDTIQLDIKSEEELVDEDELTKILEQINTTETIKAVREIVAAMDE